VKLTVTMIDNQATSAVGENAVIGPNPLPLSASLPRKPGSSS
jgi:hypothetical protein